MKRKIVWLVVSCLMVAALVLASCAPTVTEEEKAVEEKMVEEVKKEVKKEKVVKEVVALGPEVPKYGGTLTAVLPRACTDLDCALSSATHSHPLHLTHETLAIGDWTKGPAGTNEYDFSQNLSLAEFDTGDLAESWEVPDPNTIIWHIRKGVHFALNPKSEASRLVNGREMTAEDVAFCIERKFAPGMYFGKSRPGWLKSATATDKWTVVLKAEEVTEQTTMMFEYLLHYINVYPPEVIAKYGKMSDWRNSVGTGPFMLTDSVDASSYTFVRNPNYWMKDPVGPGKGNQLPYLDQVKWLMILDKSTSIAALRTAKVDYVGTLVESNLVYEDARGLLKTNPELKSYGYLGTTQALMWRVDKPELPFDDVRVRRALHMAIDYRAIKDDYYLGEAKIVIGPIPDFFDGYTPLEQLPKSTQELFSYNPEKAKQLLAEAGYPKGFKTSIVCLAVHVDVLSIVAHYWEKIGVELELDVKESVVFNSIRNARSHKEILQGSIPVDTTGVKWSNTDPLNYTNASMVDDPYINQRSKQKWAFENMENKALRDQLDKEFALRVLDQAYYAALPSPYLYNIWQPWVKNYRGEVALGKSAFWSWLAYVWIDQELKKEMTGRR